ncbi:MAG: hypothetical protein ACRDFB_10005, partial [Rhabdochlamydiaceae bacterium]
MKEQSPFDILDRLKNENWSTLNGLIYYSLGIFLLSCAIAFLLKGLGVGDALREINIPVNVWWILYSIFLIEVVHFILWIIKRNGFYTSEKILVL